jgi:AraC family transcriptional regulator
MPSTGEAWNIPSVSEPVLIWVTSGEVEVQERETNGPWLTSRVKKGCFFLAMGGSPYDCRWKTLTSEPFEVMHVLVGLPLLERALEEVFGADAIHAQLRDVSGFSDLTLDSLIKQLQRADTPEGKPPFRAKRRPSDRHPSCSKLRRSR